MEKEKIIPDISRRDFFKKTAATFGGLGIIIKGSGKPYLDNFPGHLPPKISLPPCNPGLIDWDGRPELPFHSDPLYYFSKGDGTPGILAEHIIKSGLLQPFEEQEREKRIDFISTIAEFPYENPVFYMSFEYNDGKMSKFNRMVIKEWAKEGFSPVDQDARRMFRYPCSAFKLPVTDRRIGSYPGGQYYLLDVFPIHVIHPTIPDFIIFGVRTDPVSQRIQPNNEKFRQIYAFDLKRAAREGRFAWPYPLFMFDFDQKLLNQHREKMCRSRFANFILDLVLNLGLDKRTDTGIRLTCAFEHLQMYGYFPEDMNGFCVPIELMPTLPELKINIPFRNNRKSLFNL